MESPGKGAPTKTQKLNLLARPLCRVVRDTAMGRGAIREFEAQWQARASETALRILHQAAASAERCKAPVSRIRQWRPRRPRRRRRPAKLLQRLLTSWINHVRSTPRKDAA